ncbi:MAG: hypothetical protein ONB23_08235, partial [candidate division KSB1 bacterium]|nr:hypothetical protein [candidate division KSB1 bacterium]
EQFYLPAHPPHHSLFQDNARPAKELAAWRKRVVAQWGGVRIAADGEIPEEGVRTGDRVVLRARLSLGQLSKDDVSVQAVIGPIDSQGQILEPEVYEMTAVQDDGDSMLYQCEVECRLSGRLGYAVRALPHHPDLVHPFTPVLVTWET